MSKNYRDYADIDDYGGTRGYMIAIVSDLELIHASPVTDGTVKSSISGFSFMFPKSGMHTTYLQLKDRGTVKNLGFALHVR